MPEYFDWSAEIKLKNRPIISTNGGTTCREQMAISLKSSATMSLRCYSRRDFLYSLETTEIESCTFSVGARKPNIGHIEEIYKAFEKFGPLQIVSNLQQVSPFNSVQMCTIYITGHMAYPVWWWVTLATRKEIATYDGTFLEAIMNSNIYNMETWYISKDRDNTRRAWKRLVRRDVTPNTKQCLYFEEGPVAWFLHRPHREMLVNN